MSITVGVTVVAIVAIIAAILLIAHMRGKFMDAVGWMVVISPVFLVAGAIYLLREQTGWDIADAVIDLVLIVWIAWVTRRQQRFLDFEDHQGNWNENNTEWRLAHEERHRVEEPEADVEDPPPAKRDVVTGPVTEPRTVPNPVVRPKPKPAPDLPPTEPQAITKATPAVSARREQEWENGSAELTFEQKMDQYMAEARAAFDKIAAGEGDEE